MPYYQFTVTAGSSSALCKKEIAEAITKAHCAVTGAPEHYVNCSFTEVPEEKVAKNRVHLDLSSDGSIEDEVQRLEGLGAAVRNWTEDGGSMWCVMLDPQGNEFCVVSPSGDDDGDQD